MLCSEYYSRGFIRGRFCGTHIAQALENLFRGQPKPGFRWEQKYPNTMDLRPDAHSYDPCFISELGAAGVPGMLSEAVGPDMTLFHIQVRASGQGPSYMDWHRDTYTYDGQTVGNMPPVHKLILYPTLGIGPAPKLKLLVGSHRMQMLDRESDLHAIGMLPVEVLMSSDDGFIIFDTSMLHGAIADDGVGSIRVIYSFIRRPQLMEMTGDRALHLEQSRLYDML